MKTPNLSANYIHRSFESSALLPVLVLLACFALSPEARATCQVACLTNRNTVQGDNALISLFNGSDNTAIGYSALLNNTGGIGNTANGSNTLSSNTTGNDNTAIGYEALFSNTNGGRNTAVGSFALEL